MANTQYVKYIVKIFSNKRRVGIGVIVKKENDTTYILTCDHVVCKDGKEKEKLSVQYDELQESQKIEVQSGKKFCVDLAILKLNYQIDDKCPVSMQKGISSEIDLEIATYKKMENPHHSPYDGIDTKMVERTFIEYYGRDFDAFEISASDIETGYSGSPLFDTTTNQVVGILSIKDKENRGYAIDIRNVEKLMPELSLKMLRPKKIFSSDRWFIVFDDGGHQDGKYRVQINHEDLFENNERKSLGVIKESLTEYLQNKEEFLIERVELVLPFALMIEDIPRWQFEDGTMLNEKYEVIIRSAKKYNLSHEMKKKFKEKWTKNFENNEDKSIEDVIRVVKSTHQNIQLPSRVVATVFDYPVKEKSALFKTVDDLIMISLWVNSCDNIQKFHDFFNNMKAEKFEEMRERYFDQLATDNECSLNTNLMWDDPNTLPKEIEYE